MGEAKRRKAYLDKRQTKPDTGIARLEGSNFPIKEELRDKLKATNWEEPPAKRGFDPNTATTDELIKHRFSGIRRNALNGMTEIWLFGRVRGDVKTEAVELNPGILMDLHERVFQTNGSVLLIGDDEKKTSDGGIILPT